MDEESKQLHELEQSLATTAENFPPMWRRVYENSMRSGFTADEAMKIVLTLVHGTFGGKMAP